MKGSVYQRGKTWTYRFLAPERDSATGRYPTISKGSYLTEKEAWKACRDAMREADNWPLRSIVDSDSCTVLRRMAARDRTDG